MELSLPALPLPARIRPEKRVTDDEFPAFCRAHDRLNIERQSYGEIIVTTPADGQTNRRQLFEPGSIEPDGPVAGFRLTLKRMWAWASPFHGGKTRSL